MMVTPMKNCSDLLTQGKYYDKWIVHHFHSYVQRIHDERQFGWREGAFRKQKSRSLEKQYVQMKSTTTTVGIRWD